MATLEGNWIYIESAGKTHVGMVTAIRKNGITSVPATNEDILDADRITLCPAYDYVAPTRPSFNNQFNPNREFVITSMTNSLEDLTLHVMNGNIVFFSEMSAAFVSTAADAMYAAINDAEINNTGTIVAKL